MRRWETGQTVYIPAKIVDYSPFGAKLLVYVFKDQAPVWVWSEEVIRPTQKPKKTRKRNG